MDGYRRRDETWFGHLTCDTHTRTTLGSYLMTITSLAEHFELKPNILTTT